MVHRSLGILCILLAVLFGSTAASAQFVECYPNPCSEVKIFNCTTINFQVSFKLCCNGQSSVTPYLNAPAVACPNPSASYNFSPCTITAVYKISPTPPDNVGWTWDPTTCYLKIYYL